MIVFLISRWSGQMGQAAVVPGDALWGRHHQPEGLAEPVPRLVAEPKPDTVRPCWGWIRMISSWLSGHADVLCRARRRPSWPRESASRLPWRPGNFALCSSGNWGVFTDKLEI